jgi:hypothetical protein
MLVPGTNENLRTWDMFIGRENNDFLKFGSTNVHRIFVKRYIRIHILKEGLKRKFSRKFIFVFANIS